MAGRSNYITKEGFRVLEAELDQLWRVERPRVTREVSIAAAHGDRSENAEYIYGKKRLREIDGRLRWLQKRLDELVIVEHSSDQEGRVFFGAWVTLEDEEGAEHLYRIVGPDEFDAAAQKVSMDSPIGRALLGKRVDDVVEVRRPRGDASFTVIDIRYSDPRAKSR